MVGKTRRRRKETRSKKRNKKKTAVFSFLLETKEMRFGSGCVVLVA